MRLRLLILVCLFCLLGASLSLAATPQPSVGTSAFLPLVAQAAPGVRLLSEQSYRSAPDTLTVVGELLNELPEPVYLVVVTGSFFDAAGQLLAQKESIALLVSTGPGQRTPFRLQLSPAPQAIASYTLALRWSNSNRSDYRQLEVLSPVVRTTPEVLLTGEVRNNEQQDVRTGKVVVTFYDAAGQVVEAAAEDPSKTRLESDKRAAFEVRTGRTFAFASYTVVSEGYLVP